MDIHSDRPTEQRTNWALLLPQEVFSEIMLVLRAALPPPAVDEPEEGARRDCAAMAAVGSLAPETAVEARLAAQFVAMDAYASDCLRQANEFRMEPDVARKCVAQAVSMMRESKSSLNLLLRMQAVRRLVAKDRVVATQTDMAEHAVVNMMAETLTRVVGARPVGPASGGEWKLRPISGQEIKPSKMLCETVTRLRMGAKLVS